MQREPRAYVADIIAACDAIAVDIAGIDLDTYLGNRAIRSAVEREFIIVGEAVNALGDLEPVLFGRITQARKVVVSVAHLRATGTAECLDPNYGELHVAEEADGTWIFNVPQVRVECLRCGSTFWIKGSDIVPESLHQCPACGAEHEIPLGWRLVKERRGRQLTGASRRSHFVRR